MKFTNNKTYPILGTIILLIIASWLFAKKPFNSLKNNTPADNQPDISQTALPNSEGENGAPTPTGAKTIEGVLKISNNLKRGNLILKADTVTIYIFTSRDFSSLLDKQVIVAYEGNLDHFVLQDIKQK